MKLLLDTHAILAVLGDAETIRARVEHLLNEPGNEKLVSVASFWEMSIKVALGKLRMQRLPDVVMEEFIQAKNCYRSAYPSQSLANPQRFGSASS